MNNALFQFAHPANEPVKEYRPGSPERVALEKELEKQSKEVVDPVHDFPKLHFVLSDRGISNRHLRNKLDWKGRIQLPDALSRIRDIVHIVPEIPLDDQNHVVTPSKSIISPGIRWNTVGSS